MSYKWLAALSCLFLLVLYACTNKESIHIDGSTTVLPIIAEVAEEFRSQYPDIRLIVNAGGSGVAVHQVGAGRVHIGMISRDLTDFETASYPQVDFVTHIIGRDAVIPAVSKYVYDAGVRQLSIDQLRAIYTGEITNWAEVGGPDRHILVIDKERSRGTRHVFMEVITGHPEAEAPGADLVLGANNELQTAIMQSNSAIGVLSWPWLNENVRGLAVITDDGEIIEPTKENIRNGQFPIIRNIELITNGQPSGIASDFIDFVLSEQGQKKVEDFGYARVDN